MRPFPNAHWALPALLVLLWEFVIFGQPCKEGPRYLEVALLSTTICIALWSSHFRMAPDSMASRFIKFILGALYDLGSLLLIVVVVGIPLAVITPTYQCYTNRAKISERLLYSSSLREQINERALQNNSLANVGAGLEVKPSGRTKGGLVMKDGVILVYGEDPPAVIVLMPTYENGAVTWKCTGFPLKYMPASCRD